MQLAGRARLDAAGVSAREAETLAAVGQRLSNREIAARMFISVRTVESHVSSLLRKLGLPDRSALVRLAQQLPGEQVLPVSATSFVGRAEELAEVTRMLAASPLVCLAGPAGCGKTRLAVETARLWRGEVRMVELAGAADRDVTALIAAGLGIGYEARDLVAAARVALARTDTLLVVGNCEHVIRAAGDVLAALAGSVPRLRILATERNVLRRLAVLPGEFTLALAEAACRDAAGADIRPVLTRLVEQSLVSVRLPAGEPARYWLLAVIRAFALAHADPAAGEQVARAHAVFFSGLAAEAVRARFHAAPGRQPAAGYDEPNLLAALAWSADHAPDLADPLLAAVSQLAETEPSRQALELIRDVASRCPPDWSSEALARAGVALSYLSLEHAELLARKSDRAAVTERDRAFANWVSGWVHAYRREEDSATRRLALVISYATGAGDPWLEGSSLQARGTAREQPRDAFADWEQAVSRFVATGDLIHANNARYMLASKAVETHTRLADVPVWLDECESYATRHGLGLELAHIRRVRAGYQILQDDPGAARKLLDAALPVFREAGDFRCIARTLLELAQPPLTDDPAAGPDLLVQSLGAAAIASNPAMHALILTRLIATGAAAGGLALAARCLGALDALGQPAGREAARPPLVAPGLSQTLRGPAYATYVDEGRTGGINLITTLYAR